MKLHFTGIPPSLKNNKMLIGGSRPRLISSKAYREWEQAQMWLLSWRKKLPEPPYHINYVFKIKDKRKWDLSNKVESISDALVHYGVIPDDNWSVIASYSVSWVKADEAGVEVEILNI